MKLARITKSFLHKYRSKKVFQLCDRYVKLYNSDNEGKMFDNGESFLAATLIPNSKTVFDVGSNNGQWARMALKINSELNIHCFEPSKKTFQLLSENKFNKNIKLNNLALGSEIGLSKLNVIEEGSGGNSLYRRQGIGWNSDTKTESIELNTLDNYCSTNGIEEIDFLKIDTEGHEYKVLQGGKNLIRAGKIHAIQFEYGGTWIDSGVFLKDMFNFVKECNPNCKFSKLTPNGPLFVKEYKQSYESFLMSNWLISFS